MLPMAKPSGADLFRVGSKLAGYLGLGIYKNCVDGSSGANALICITILSEEASRDSPSALGTNLGASKITFIASQGGRGNCA